MPGNDIDIDFNNDGSVSQADFALWLENWGNEYPPRNFVLKRTPFFYPNIFEDGLNTAT